MKDGLNPFEASVEELSCSTPPSDGAQTKTKPRKGSSATVSLGPSSATKSWRCLLVAVGFVVSFSIGFSAALAASVQHHPQNQVAVLYHQAGFGVIGEPAPNLAYQWRKDGVIIPGATTDQFVLGTTRLFDAGMYSVIVSDGSGSITSADAELTVRLPMAGDLDNSFIPDISSPGSIADRDVTAIALQPDGRLLVAVSEEYGASYLLRLNPDGTPDYTWMNRSQADSAIFCVDVAPDGKVVIGGSFTRVDGIIRNRIARLNSDGSLDSSFQNGLAGVNFLVRSVALQTDGKALIAGGFTTINGTTRPYVARLNPDGTLDASFLSGLSGPNNSVSEIVLEDDGQILIGGGFTVVNNVNRKGIARLNADGTLDNGFLDGQSGVSGSSVSSIAVDDGKVVIAGAFTNVNDASRNLIARLNPDGTLDTGFVSRLTGLNSSVSSVVITRDRKLLIGGGFFITNRVTQYNVALLNEDGTEDSSFLRYVSPYGTVASLAEQTNGQVLIGGSFWSVNGVSRYNFARLNRNGALDEAFNAPVGPNRSVACTAVQTDGKLLIGGIFSEVSGAGRNGIARLNADGTLDRGFAGAVPGSTVLSVAVQTDGKILFGGGAGSPGLGRLGRLNTNGTSDSSFLATANSTVESIAVQADGRILIGGRFTNVNGVSRHGIARLLTNGSVDNGFLNGLAGVRDGSSTSVGSIALQGDGKILIGGSFLTVNGITRSNLARLNDNGTLDTNFLSVGANRPVDSVVVQPDGKIVIGGSFSRVNGETRSSIARLNGDGTLDGGFQPPQSGIGRVRSMSVQPDGRILVGSGFPAFILRLNPDGTRDNHFQTVLAGPAVAWGGYTENSVHTVALLRDGKALIGGDFSVVNGAPVPYLARLWTDQPPYIESISPPGGGSATLTLRLPLGSTNRVQYKTSLSTEWIDLPGELIQGVMDAPTNKVDASLGMDGQRFYRVITNPPL